MPVVSIQKGHCTGGFAKVLRNVASNGFLHSFRNVVSRCAKHLCDLSQDRSSVTISYNRYLVFDLDWLFSAPVQTLSTVKRHLSPAREEEEEEVLCSSGGVGGEISNDVISPATGGGEKSDVLGETAILVNR